MVRRSTGLEAGSAPPDLTAMVMSLAIRANCFAMRFHRANIVCLRTSKMRPMVNRLKTPGAFSAGQSDQSVGVQYPNDPRERPVAFAKSMPVGGRLTQAARAELSCGGA